MKKLLLILIFIVPSYLSKGQSNTEKRKGNCEDICKEYFDKGNDKSDQGDYYGAIYEYTKVIEMMDFYPPAIVNRAIAKGKIGDFPSAFNDINMVIDKVPVWSSLYKYRALIKVESKDYYGAVSDYSKAIELDPNKSDFIKERGDVKAKLKDYDGACGDWRISASMGNQDAKIKISEGCE